MSLHTAMSITLHVKCPSCYLMASLKAFSQLLLQLLLLLVILVTVSSINKFLQDKNFPMIAFIFNVQNEPTFEQMTDDERTSGVDMVSSNSYEIISSR